jgi:hypothetical protein
VNTEQWWNDNDREKLKDLEKRPVTMPRILHAAILIYCEDVNWIKLAQDTVYREGRSSVVTNINIQIP